MNAATNSRPRSLIIRSAGINCDEELAHAYELAGARAEFVHLNTLIEAPERFDEYDIISFPGGFSFGDDVAGGAIFAMHVREHLYPALLRAIQRGTPIFAVCNGFQVLVKLGLLPGPALTEAWPIAEPPAQTIALTDNAGGRFIDDWVKVEVNADSPCIWTKNIDAGQSERMMMLPIAHGEGRMLADDPATIEQLEASNQVALRYAADDNPNGSVGDIAGICDASGLIFGLMPHPERYVRREHHPSWTRSGLGSDTPVFGLAIFRNAVEHAGSKGLVGSAREVGSGG